MSPPIYTPDGTEVSEIVLPDGSTASEVIGPDGNVVFEAGPDIPDSGVDNWEDADNGGIYDSGETIPDYYSGDTSVWQRQTSVVFSGGYAAEGSPSGPRSGNLYGNTSIPFTISPGETAQIAMQTGNTDSLVSLFFNVQDSDNHFGAGFAPNSENGRIDIVKFDGGSFSRLNSTTDLGLPNNEWEVLELDWQTDDTIVWSWLDGIDGAVQADVQFSITPFADRSGDPHEQTGYQVNSGSNTPDGLGYVDRPESGS